MKKIKYFLIMAFSILLLSACTMKYETDVNIKTDGSMEFAIIAGYDKEFISAMISAGSAFNTENTKENEVEDETTTNEPTDAEIEEFFYGEFSSEESSLKEAENLGFKTEKYHEGDFYGYKYVADISHIDTVSGEEEVKFDISKVIDESNTTKIQDQKIFRKQGNVYYATFTFDPSEQNPDPSELSGESETDPESQALLNQYMESLGFDYKFVVTLPNEANDNNATEVSEDKKTLTWKLGSSQATDINFTFELGKGAKPVITPGSEGPNIPLVIGIAGGAILLVIIIFVVTSKLKKGKASKEENTSENTSNVQTPVSEQEAPTQSVQQEMTTTPVMEMPGETQAVDSTVQANSFMVQPTFEATEVVTPEVTEPVITPEVPQTSAEVASVAPAEEVVPVASVEPVSTPVVETPAVEPVAPVNPTEPVASMVAPVENAVSDQPINTNTNM